MKITVSGNKKEISIKKYWIAVQIETEGKRDAAIIPVTENDNLLSKLNIRDIITANIFNTQDAARDAVLAWRDEYIKSGVYRWEVK